MAESSFKAPKRDIPVALRKVRNIKKTTLFFAFYVALSITQTSSVYGEDVFQEGALEWGASAGFGTNFHAAGNVRDDIQFYSLFPSVGKVLKKWDGGGSLDFIVEGFLSYARQVSKARYAGGITPLFAYNLKALGKAVPFIELGVGILYTDLDPKNFGSKFDLTPQAGIGVRYEIGHGKFLKLSYRLHHISNAGIDADNGSIDSHFFLIGLSFIR
ncbi:MAG: acyloxyacyl hydrolase [Thermodesulfobacteriota bacterium]